MFKKNSLILWGKMLIYLLTVAQNVKLFGYLCCPLCFSTTEYNNLWFNGKKWYMYDLIYPLLASSQFFPSSSYYTEEANLNVLTFPSLHSHISYFLFPKSIPWNYPCAVSLCVIWCLLSEVSTFQTEWFLFLVLQIANGFLNVVPMQCCSTVLKCSLLLNLPWCTNDVFTSIQADCM